MIDHALLSPIMALLGALVGGITSFFAAIYIQRFQNRLQRVQAEIAKRETVYADFVVQASRILVDAYVREEIELGGDEQRLVGLINRMRLFASPAVIAAAEAVLKAIVEIALRPGVQLRELASRALSEDLDPDPLLAFSLVCRSDLDRVNRTFR